MASYKTQASDSYTLGDFFLLRTLGEHSVIFGKVMHL